MSHPRTLEEMLECQLRHFLLKNIPLREEEGEKSFEEKLFERLLELGKCILKEEMPAGQEGLIGILLASGAQGRKDFCKKPSLNWALEVWPARPGLWQATILFTGLVCALAIEHAG